MRGERFQQICGACNFFCWQFPKQENGPAHVVISDFNFEDTFVRSCLDAVNDAPAGDGGWQCRLLLEWMLTFPEEERLPAEDSYSL